MNLPGHSIFTQLPPQRSSIFRGPRFLDGHPARLRGAPARYTVHGFTWAGEAVQILCPGKFILSDALKTWMQVYSFTFHNVEYPNNLKGGCNDKTGIAQT